VAAAVGVEPFDVTVAVRPASVLLATTILVDEDQTVAVLQAVETQLATAETASAMLSSVTGADGSPVEVLSIDGPTVSYGPVTGTTATADVRGDTSSCDAACVVALALGIPLGLSTLVSSGLALYFYNRMKALKAMKAPSRSSLDAGFTPIVVVSPPLDAAEILPPLLPVVPDDDPTEDELSAVLVTRISRLDTSSYLDGIGGELRDAGTANSSGPSVLPVVVLSDAADLEDPAGDDELSAALVTHISRLDTSSNLDGIGREPSAAGIAISKHP